MNTDRLYKTLWETKGARFNAYARLNRLSNYSTWVIALYSLIAILISIITLINNSTHLLIINIFLSVVVIALSYIENSKNYQLKAERLHISAMEIGTLYKKLVMHRDGIQLMTDYQIASLMMQYDELIKKCPENHDLNDHDLFKAQHPNDYGLKPFQANLLNFWTRFCNAFFHLLLLALGVLIFVWVLTQNTHTPILQPQT